jgi:hypothetical protein
MLPELLRTVFYVRHEYEYPTAERVAVQQFTCISCALRHQSRLNLIMVCVLKSE